MLYIAWCYEEIVSPFLAPFHRSHRNRFDASGRRRISPPDGEALRAYGDRTRIASFAARAWRERRRPHGSLFFSKL